MAMLEDQGTSGSDDPSPAVAEPLLYEGQRLDQPTFHATLRATCRKTSKAELIDGVVYLMNMTVFDKHGEADSAMIGFLFHLQHRNAGHEVREGEHDHETQSAQ